MALHPPRLLPDEPTNADSFGAHQRIANALATLIESSDGGKSIRLDGAWGAGKSTVVQMLREQLAKKYVKPDGQPSGFAMFTYDAWVHSGDRLRRAFFEGLVKSTTTHEWIRSNSKTDKYWQATLLSMAGKRKRVKKTTDPLSRRARVAVAFSVTLALLSPALYKLLSMTLGDVSVSQLAELIGLGGLALCLALYGISAADLHVLLTRSTLEEVTETTADPDPSSLEFQEKFNDLMSQVLLPGRKLLIVIDNLDRVEEEEAKQIWTLLRSFLDNPAFRDREWFKRLWLLVPIAEKASVGLTGLNIDGAEPNLFAEPTLEKIFQVRMSLPRPMLRSWKQYLIEKLTYSFGPDERGDYEMVARIMQAVSDTPTPREIVIFINSLVALQIERKGDMPLATLAAYLLSRDKEQLKSWQIGPRVGQVYMPDTLMQDFATLHLHADKTADSLYLLIMPELERVLKQGDPVELAKVLASSPAALDVLDGWLTRTLSQMSQSPETANAAQPEFLAYLRALLLFKTKELSEPSFANVLNHVRPRIDRVIEATTTLSLSDPNVAAGVDAYLQLAMTEARAKSRMVFILEMSVRTEGPKETSNPPAAWNVWVRSLAEVLSNQSIRGELLKRDNPRIRLGTTPGQWATLCEAWQSEPAHCECLDLVDTTAPDEELAAWIGDRLADSTGSSRRLETVLYQSAQARGSGFYSQVIGGTVELLRKDANTTLELVLSVFTSLIKASPQDARLGIREATRTEAFIVWARDGSPAGTFTLRENVARLATIYLWATEGIPSTPHSIDLSGFASLAQGFFHGKTYMPRGELLIACAEQILDTGIYDVVPLIAEQSTENHAVLSEILKHLVVDVEFREVATAELLAGQGMKAPQIISGAQRSTVREILTKALAERKAAEPA